MAWKQGIVYTCFTQSLMCNRVCNQCGHAIGTLTYRNTPGVLFWASVNSAILSNPTITAFWRNQRGHRSSLGQPKLTKWRIWQNNGICWFPGVQSYKGLEVNRSLAPKLLSHRIYPNLMHTLLQWKWDQKLPANYNWIWNQNRVQHWQQPTLRAVGHSVTSRWQQCSFS